MVLAYDGEWVWWASKKFMAYSTLSEGPHEATCCRMADAHRTLVLGGQRIVSEVELLCPALIMATGWLAVPPKHGGGLQTGTLSSSQGANRYSKICQTMCPPQIPQFDCYNCEEMIMDVQTHSPSTVTTTY